MATIGVIEYGGYVSGVSVDLADGATISPDPNDFLGSWPQSQEFIVSKGEVAQKWTVRLTKYVSELPQIDGKDVIFRDEFDTDGEVNSEFWSLIGKGTAAWQTDMSGKAEHSYVKNGNLISFKAIERIYTDEEFILCRSAAVIEADNGEKHYEPLNQFDEIIIKGTDLYDGKVI